MPWLSWEMLFSMLCMLCTDKGSSLNLNNMVSNNYVMIMIMVIYIRCIYVCHYLTGSCCSGCNTLQNFGLHPNFGAFLGFSFDGCKHSSSLHEILWSISTLLFVWPMIVFWKFDCFVMVVILFWWVWRFVFVCFGCLRYVNTHRTHTQSCKHCCTSVVTVIQRSIMSVALVTLSSKIVSPRSCFVFFSWWYMFSCCQVC